MCELAGIHICGSNKSDVRWWKSSPSILSPLKHIAVCLLGKVVIRVALRVNYPCNYTTIPRGRVTIPLIPEHQCTVGNCHFGEVGVWGRGLAEVTHQHLQPQGADVAILVELNMLNPAGPRIFASSLVFTFCCSKFQDWKLALVLWVHRVTVEDNPLLPYSVF